MTAISIRSARPALCCRRSLNGTLYDLVDPSASVVWKAQVNANPSAPSYDATAGIVVIGDAGGAITAFNAKTGVQLWKVSTGGPVAGSPAIATGTVYAGSGDGNLYAINETTGAVTWKFTADSAIPGAPTVFALGQISFGSQNGTLYQLSPSGAEIYAQPSSFFANSPIVANAAVPNNVVTETTKGFVDLTRNNPPELPWKYDTGAALATAPAINDGAVYVGAVDGGLYAFTPQGHAPSSASKVRATVITVTDAWSCASQ
jgi:outer membrane protein assembly factor BamB